MKVNWKKWLIGEISWKRLIRSILFIYTALLIVALCFGDYLIFAPPAPCYTEKSPHIHCVSNSTGKIATFYLPASDGMPTLLWSHGNAEDLSNTFFYQQFHQHGFGIYAYDYPGYGLSSGKPSEQACYAAIDSCYHDLVHNKQVPTDSIFLVGQSVGSGPTCYLAESRPAAGVILISPLTSIYRVGFHYPIFPGDRFPNIDRIKRIKQPLMVLHGDQDSVIPQWHGKALAQAHPGKTHFHSLSGRDHNDIFGGLPRRHRSHHSAQQRLRNRL